VRLINLQESQIVITRRVGGDWAEDHRQHCRQMGARVGAPYAEVFRPCLLARRTPPANLLP